MSGDVRNIDAKAKNKAFPKEEEYPEDCIVDFDFKLIDLFKKMAEDQKKLIDLVKEEFYRIKDELGRVPTRYEMYKYIDDDIYSSIRAKTKINIFNDYLGFLNSIDELTEEEKSLVKAKAHDFIKLLETTSMTKTYKMPLLLAFYNNGYFKLSVTEEEIYLRFKEFYSKASNAVDLIRDKSTKYYLTWGKKEYLRIAKNPRAAFLNSADEFFYDN